MTYAANNSANAGRFGKSQLKMFVLHPAYISVNGCRGLVIAENERLN